MARPDGVVVVSGRFWAFAGTDGTVREGSMPQPRPAVRHVPLVRGLVRLSASLSPLFRRTGVARPFERRALLAAVLAPCVTIFLPSPFGLLAGLGVALGLVAWMLRGRTLHLHGAEHRAIAAAVIRPFHVLTADDAREPLDLSGPALGPSFQPGGARPPAHTRPLRRRHGAPRPVD